MRYLTGFALCFVVGLVLSFVGAAVVAVMQLPHELSADSTVMDYVRPMVAFAIVFAIVCTVARALHAARASHPS